MDRQTILFSQPEALKGWPGPLPLPCWPWKESCQQQNAIMAIRQKFAVIGLGQFGSAIAKALSEKDYEVMAIDNDPAKIESIKDDVASAVEMDASDPKALIAQSIKDFDAVVVAIGENFEHLLLCTVMLQELGVTRIYARARGKNQRIILEKLGIEEVFQPEDEVAAIVAEKLINPSVVSYLSLPDDYRVAELKTPKNIANRTLGDINLRDRYNLSLITIKKEIERVKEGKTILEEHIEGVPNSKSIILPNHRLVVFGKAKDIDRFTEINQ
jgi:trk system potassium uptake protein TrkA